MTAPGRPHSHGGRTHRRVRYAAAATRRVLSWRLSNTLTAGF
jgi:putative transposase